MYDAALALHSWLRWAILLLGFLAVTRAVSGRSRGTWTSADDRVGMLLTRALELQMLIGLILYFGLSPISHEGMLNIGAAMANSSLRFWTVEHPFGMVLGIALAHIGQSRIRKTGDGVKKHRTALIFYTLALVVILLTIPWPGRLVGRPLFRGL